MRMADCHPERKHSGKGLCKPCYLQYWRVANPERAKAISRASYERNAVEKREKARLFRLNNREKCREINRRTYQKHKDKRRVYLEKWKDRSRVQVLSWRYKAPEQVVIKLLAVAACETCGSTEDLHFDHDHQTGVLRGRLCKACNMAVGLLRDSHDIAFAVGRYLLKHKNMAIEPYGEYVDRRTVQGRAIKKEGWAVGKAASQ